MPLRILIWTGFSLLAMVACTAPRPMSPDSAQKIWVDAWHADRHTVWEMEWPAVPIGGSLTVETWRKGDRYRFEILETAAPTLMGQTLVFDGQDAWRYNRLNPPATLTPTSPMLSPVTDAFAIINRLARRSPERATQQVTQVNDRPAQKIMVTFANGDTLALWQDTATGLPVRLVLSVEGQQITLKARRAEPLPNPPEELFGVGNWIYNVR